MPNGLPEITNAHPDDPARQNPTLTPNAALLIKTGPAAHRVQPISSPPATGEERCEVLRIGLNPTQSVRNSDPVSIGAAVGENLAAIRG